MEVKDKPEVVKAKSKPTVLPGDFGLAQHKRRDFVVEVGVDVTKEEILDPGYWAHIASEFQPFDKIEARWQDGSRIVNLRVKFAERAYANVQVISEEVFGDMEAEIAPQSLLFDIKWRGPMHRYSVIRKSDSAVVSSGHHQRSSAVAWITEHERG